MLGHKLNGNTRRSVIRGKVSSSLHIVQYPLSKKGVCSLSRVLARFALHRPPCLPLRARLPLDITRNVVSLHPRGCHRTAARYCGALCRERHVPRHCLDSSHTRKNSGRKSSAHLIFTGQNPAELSPNNCLQAGMDEVEGTVSATSEPEQMQEKAKLPGVHSNFPDSPAGKN